MSGIAQSQGSPRGSRSERFARTAPAQVQSFSDFQATRMARLSEVTADLRARRAREARNLEIRLQDLTMQLNSTRASMEDDEREFITRREVLTTELQNVKTEADIAFSQEQIAFMRDREQIQREYDERFKTLMSSVRTNLTTPPPQDNEELLKTKSRITKLQNNVKQLEQASRKLALDYSDFREDDQRQLYMDRVTELEEQKRELIQAIQDEQRSDNDRLSELSGMIHEQDNRFKAERDEISDQMSRKEAKYRNTIDKLYNDLERIQGQRMGAIENGKQRIAEIRGQIDKIETELRAKLRDANRITAKLKVKLTNANLRRTQQIEAQRERSREQQELMRESLVLQERVHGAERRFEKAREQTSLLRQELSAKIGPRKTASLFI